MACIELGLSEDEFHNKTPRQTFIMQLNHRRKNERTWEHTRYLASMVHNMAQGKKRNVTPQQLVRLSIDQKRLQSEQVTVEEALEVIKKWKIPFNPSKN